MRAPADPTTRKRSAGVDGIRLDRIAGTTERTKMASDMEQGGDIGAIVVGTTYGVLTHARALRQAGFSVEGLVGRDEQKTKKRSEQMGVPHAFTNLNEALDLPGASVVVVATPPHTHAPITLASIAAGKHVLCEKPFALNLPEARKMLEAAERAGVIHLLGTEYRFTTTQTAFRRVLASGSIGEPRFGIFVRHMASLVDPTWHLPDWWESASEGGGWLGAAGSHLIDEVRSSIGEFTALSASLDQLSSRPQMTADDSYSLHYQLANGCTGVLQGSCAVSGPPLSVTRVAGTRGSVWVQPRNEEHSEEVWMDTGSGPERVSDPVDVPRVPPDPPPEELWPLHEKQGGWHTRGADLAPYTHLYQCLRAQIEGEPVGDDPPVATFYDGVAGQAVLDAARFSAAGAGWVEVQAI